MTTLFRPVGLNELALIWDSGMRQFPPRLPHQPIFYPVANIDYAGQIAKDWNTKDEGSGFAGYVTGFDVPQDYLATFEPHTVGAASHVEYWIPSGSLDVFNAAIQGTIRIQSAYFGIHFKGYVPDGFGLSGKDGVSQFVIFFKTWDYSRMDFVCEVATNRKAVYLNFPFWTQFDFSPLGISNEQRDATLGKLREAWEFNHIVVPLPC
jgi:hypothetical protein